MKAKYNRTNIPKLVKYNHIFKKLLKNLVMPWSTMYEYLMNIRYK